MGGKRGIEKSFVIHVLEIDFTLLNRKNGFIISAPIEYIAEVIRESTVYIALNINTCKIKSLCINISGI